MTDDISYGENVPTGIPGLDNVLAGGLPATGLYLVLGNPGVGKTTFTMQFLLEGARRQEKCLYVSFSETRQELEAVGRAHGWPLDQIHIYELSGTDQPLGREPDQTMFHPAEVELAETLAPILNQVRKLRPTRVVIDSVSEIRLMARDPLRYRRQLLALKQFFVEQNCTVLLVDDRMNHDKDDIVQTLVHGILVFEKLTPVYGSTRRQLRVEKLRGVRYREGFHDYRIVRGGIEVFPRLVASEHVKLFDQTPVSSGVIALDSLLSGGLDRGTSTLFMGAAGTGKSSLAAQYAIAAAARGEKAALYLFEESIATWVRRAEAFGHPAERFMKSGLLNVTQVDPAELSPGELAASVRQVVERDGARMVVIDSLNGYLHSVPEDRFLLLHMHELLTYLGQQGVTTLLVIAQQGFMGPSMQSPVDVSYLADAVLMLRYFEAQGSVRQAISVIKKRSGLHERTLREFGLGAGGVRVGEPLTDFHGVLTGVPTYVGADARLRRP